MIIGLALALVLLVGCENGARHSLELTEPTDHTTGDDGGKLKYKIITALLAILIALSGWSLTTTVGLKSDVAVLQEKVSGVENEIQDFKNFKSKKNRKKKKKDN